MAPEPSAGAKSRTQNDIPPNPAADRSLIVNGVGVRLWDFEADKWITPVVIASRDGTWLLGLNERAGAIVEIREA